MHSPLGPAVQHFSTPMVHQSWDASYNRQHNMSFLPSKGSVKSLSTYRYAPNFKSNVEGMMPVIIERTAQESNDYDEDFSEKLIAFARYNRNITLIKEVLSDTVMPNPRQVVSSTRLNALKEQVGVLEEHYKKVALDLEEVKKACSEKKKIFMESTDAFKTKYESLCRPVVGIKTYSELFLKHYNQSKFKTDRQQWEQTLAWAHHTAGTISNSVNTSDNQNNEIADILGIHSQGNDDTVPTAASMTLQNPSVVSAQVETKEEDL